MAHRYNIHITEKHFTNLEAVLYKNRNITPHHKLLNFYHQNRHLDKKKKFKGYVYEHISRCEAFRMLQQWDAEGPLLHKMGKAAEYKFPLVHWGEQYELLVNT